MVEIRFDSTCAAWTNNLKRNEFFIDVQLNYLTEKLRYMGYLYLNEVYEVFGAKWNTDNENICFRNADDFLVAIEKKDDVYVIKLQQR